MHMNDFVVFINEAMQRTPALKQKIQSMQREFEMAFGEKIYSKKFDYDVNVNDL